MVSTADNTTFTIDPTADFASGELCTTTVFAGQVADQDAIDPPDAMTANSLRVHGRRRAVSQRDDAGQRRDQPGGHDGPDHHV